MNKRSVFLLPVTLEIVKSFFVDCVDADYSNCLRFKFYQVNSVQHPPPCWSNSMLHDIGCISTIAMSNLSYAEWVSHINTNSSKSSYYNIIKVQCRTHWLELAIAWIGCHSSMGKRGFSIILAQCLAPWSNINGFRAVSSNWYPKNTTPIRTSLLAIPIRRPRWYTRKRTLVCGILFPVTTKSNDSSNFGEVVWHLMFVLLLYFRSPES